MGEMIQEINFDEGERFFTISGKLRKFSDISKNLI